MATNENEGLGEKVKEFFTQTPEDRSYEDAGGDSRVPEAERHGDPTGEANAYAAANGEDLPYPELEDRVVGDEVVVDRSEDVTPE